MVIMLTNLQVDVISAQFQLSTGVDLVLTSIYTRVNQVPIVSFPSTISTLLGTQFTVAGPPAYHGGSMTVVNVEFAGNSINASSLSAALVPLTNSTQTPQQGDIVSFGIVQSLFDTTTLVASAPISFVNQSVFGLRGTNQSSGGCRWADCPMVRHF